MDYEAPPMPCGCILLLLVFSHSVMSDSFETPWTAAHQAPLSMGFPRQEYCSGLPFLFTYRHTFKGFPSMLK